MRDFHQEPPRLGGNTFEADLLLRGWLRRALPAPVLAEVEPGLRRLGARAATDLLALADAAEAEPPRHLPYDPWGRRVDRIETSAAWRALDRAAAEEGIVATAYERAHGAHSRVHQLARLYLYHPSSAVYSCPLAMTDGAARALRTHGGGDPVFRAAFQRLTSRDPERFCTSGQWMTERTGGSDVSGSSTVAIPEEDGTFRLHGTKWFTSATTSQMALTLARIEGDEGAGSAGLSLFYLETEEGAGEPRGIRIHRLKDKLGTRALPTAELTLEGTPARLLGGAGHGVRKIAPLLNVTRLYNAVCAVASMRRGLELAADYATRRRAFGRPLAAHPLHAETLAALAVEHAGAFHLAFHVGELLGREETGEGSEEDALLLRLLTPVAKLYTARQAVASASEALEAFGGAGYVEDTGLPRLLRDAQVLAIWEGTTNVLSLDVLRVLSRGDALGAFDAAVARRVERVASPALMDSAARVEAARRAIGGAAARFRGDPEGAEAGARAFAFALARTFAGALLLEHAEWSLHAGGGERDAALARRWCARDLAPLADAAAGHRAGSAALVWGKGG